MLRRIPSIMQCYVCRGAVTPGQAYPQLCPSHHLDIGGALREVEDLATSLNARFDAVMKPAYDARLMAVITAAADCDLPGIRYVQTKRIEEFMRRLDATVAKGDEFADIVTAWWNARQATVDAEKLALQIAWMPVSTEVRKEKGR